MKLSRVLFDRYVTPDQKRAFDWPSWDIDLDPATLLITLTPQVGGTPLMVVAHNCDMYPKEAVSEPGPARQLPGRPRKGA